MEENKFLKLLTLEELEKVYELNDKTEDSLLEQNIRDNLASEIEKRKKEKYKLEEYLNRCFRFIVDNSSITYIYFTDFLDDMLLADVIKISWKGLYNIGMKIEFRRQQNYTVMLNYIIKNYKEITLDEYNAVYHTISDCYNNLLKKYK